MPFGVQGAATQSGVANKKKTRKRRSLPRRCPVERACLETLRGAQSRGEQIAREAPRGGPFEIARAIEARHETASVGGRSYVRFTAVVGRTPSVRLRASVRHAAILRRTPAGSGGPRCTTGSAGSSRSTHAAGVLVVVARSDGHKEEEGAEAPCPTSAHQYFTQTSSSLASDVSAVTPAVVLISSVVVALEL